MDDGKLERKPDPFLMSLHLRGLPQDLIATLLGGACDAVSSVLVNREKLWLALFEVRHRLHTLHDCSIVVLPSKKGRMSICRQCLF